MPLPIDHARELQRRCTSHGVPMTAQRRAVLEVLAHRLDHPTVEQIHAAVEERLAGVSKATVYRNLELLLRLGLVRSLAHPGSAARYDPNLEPHHHFICERCRSVLDLAPERVRGSDQLGFVLGADGLEGHEVSVLVRGTCGACRSRDSSHVEPDGPTPAHRA
jgi:Fe2+ or Zn2+ uptake regulation protein